MIVQLNAWSADLELNNHNQVTHELPNRKILQPFSSMTKAIVDRSHTLQDLCSTS